VTSLVLLINFQLNLAGLWSLAGHFADSQDTKSLLEAFSKATIQKFLLSVGLSVPLAASVGILYSFKFRGPLFRFKEYFRFVKDERWDERCFLRKGDDPKDVCDSMNEAIDTLRDKIRGDHGLLQSIKAFLDVNASNLTGEAIEKELERLQSEIKATEECYAQRFRGPGETLAQSEESLSEDATAQQPEATGAGEESPQTAESSATSVDEEKEKQLETQS